jgi:hypothetical protein
LLQQAATGLGGRGKQKHEEPLDRDAANLPHLGLSQ